MGAPDDHEDPLARRDRPRGQVPLGAPGAEDVAAVPWLAILRERLQARVSTSPRFPWIVLAVSLFGLFSVGCTITILSVSVPRIAEELHSNTSTVTWVVTAPMLAFAVLGPAMGKLGDLHGHRRVYLWSMALVTVFAGLTALAWSAGTLVGFRALGAAAGAAVGPSSIALINRLFTPDRRVQAMGYWSMVAAGGPVIGVVAGGPVVETFGWRWIFVAQVPLTLAGLLLAVVLLPETERAPRVVFDYAGAGTLAVAATSLLFAINRGPLWGWSDPLIVTGFALTPLMLALFVWFERRSEHPLLPLAYVRRPNFSFSIGTLFFIQFAYMGGFIITPLFLEDVFDYPETRVGWLMIARPLAFAITGPLAGYVATRVGERSSALAGSAFVVASMIGLSTIEPGSSDLVLVAALAVSGVGLGCAAPSLAASVANAVEEHDLGVAGAFQQMMNQLGTVVGIQVMQTVSVVREPASGAVGAYSEAYLVGGLAAVLALVSALFVRSRPRYAERAPDGALGPAQEPALA